MIELESSQIIRRPIEEVFAYMSDLRHQPEHQSGLLEMHQMTEGPVGIGTTFVGVRRFLGRKMESTMEIIEYEPNAKLTWKTISGPTPFVSSWRFESTPEGTRLIWNLEAEVGFLGLAEPLIAAAIRREAKASAGHLKDFLESRAVEISS